MKEIIQLHVGQMGVQAADPCWQLYCLQHGIDSTGHLITDKQHYNYHTLFSEASSGKLTPRSLLLDLEADVINQSICARGSLNKLYSPNNVVKGREDAANNYIRGHYTIGKEIIQQTIDKIRKQVQKTDYFEGFVMQHSINGGTGGGFSALVLQRIAVDYMKKVKVNISVYPSQRYSDSIVQNYNAVLSTHCLLQHSDIVIPITNQRMYQICDSHLDIQYPSFGTINKLIAQTTSNISAGLRLPGEMPWSLRDLSMNLVPYPRIHFVSSSWSSLGRSRYDRAQTYDMVREVFDINNCMVDIDKYNSKYISGFIMCRSRFPIYSELVFSANRARQSADYKFVQWVPTGLKLGSLSTALPSLQSSGLFQQSPLSINMLSINMRIDKLFGRINHKFDQLYAKRAFVHWYVGEGLDQGLFSQAREDLAALEKDFQDGEDYQQWSHYDQQNYQDVGGEGGYPQQQ